MAASHNKSPIIYEVNLSLPGEVADDFDLWLKSHIDEMLAIAGFVSASVYKDHPPPGIEPEPDKIYRTVQYRVSTRKALDDYFRDHAARMRQEGFDKFGEGLAATRRILVDGQEISGDTGGRESHCRNCGVPLLGQYCSACGQRGRARLITLWELLRDVVGDLFELDSRLWRSLVPLLLKPGKLTKDYLAGRRVHYVPPFRMYLVLSILFFVVISFGDETPFSIDSDDDRVTATVETEEDGDLAERSREDEAESPDRTETDATEVARKCEELELDTGISWIDSEESLEFLRNTCRQMIKNVTEDEGRFERAMYENIPKMLFFFLPFLAIVLKLLYIGSGRYYVEHLLFFVHYHAFFFLIVMLNVLLTRVAGIIHEPDWLVGLVTATVVFYIPIYLFVAMRQVYAQRFVVTLLKYGFLGITYFVSLIITLLVTAAITAISLES